MLMCECPLCNFMHAYEKLQHSQLSARTTNQIWCMNNQIYFLFGKKILIVQLNRHCNVYVSESNSKLFSDAISCMTQTQNEAGLFWDSNLDEWKRQHGITEHGYF